MSGSTHTSYLPNSKLKDKVQACEVILGNSNKRFSGVTSSMLQTAMLQNKQINLCVLGKHNMPDSLTCISFWQAAKWLQKNNTSHPYRVFHARRNDEMLQALVLKYMFGIKLKIIFTSTAQRKHSKFTCWLMSKMDSVISTNSAAAGYLQFEVDDIIAHGVDRHKFTPVIDRAELREQLGKTRYPMAGIFGRVRAQKGIHLFVQACIENCQKNFDFQAIICGSIDDPAYVNKLQNKIAQAKLSHRIKFLGEQDFVQVVKWMQACDIVCALSDNEGFGLTVLEAMSCGAAVVATKAGAWPDIIQSGQNGLLVDVNDQAAITNALHVLISRPELKMQLGLRGHQTVINNYSIEDEANKLCQFYKNVLNQTQKDLYENSTVG